VGTAHLADALARTAPPTRVAAVLHLEGQPASSGRIAELGHDRSSLGDLLAAAAVAERLEVVSEDRQTGPGSSGLTPFNRAGFVGLNLRPDGSPKTVRLLLRLAWAVASTTQFPTLREE
jgi:hypothetical protein